MSRIFLSHSSKDDFAAAAIRDWLAESGWDDVFLDFHPAGGIKPGERWERALYEHAARCEAVLFLISRNWLASDWCRREYELARKLNKRIFVVVVDDLAIPELPDYLTETHQAVALGAGADHRVFRVRRPETQEEHHVTFSKEGLARLKAGLTKAGLDPRFFAWPPENDPGRAPYRGLSPMEADDAGIFFGRDAPIVQALDALRGLAEAAPPRLFVLLGASGAGKSSFLRAGLLPRLDRDDRHFLPLPVIRPEHAMLKSERGLVSAIAAACAKAGLPETRAQIRQASEAGAQALRPILARLAGEATIVISIDQAEELFRAEGAADGEAFLSLLRDLTAVDGPRIIALFTIRSDSYDALERARPLEGLPQRTFALLPMPHGAYQTVIEGPAARLPTAGRGFEIEPALTQKLLEDIEAGGGADALPLLSFTLEQLYLDHEAAKRVTRADYESFGGFRGVIEAAMARVFAAADADPRIPKDRDARLALLRRGLIPWLAGVDPETKTARRRRAPVAQIPQEARPLIDLLVEQRLLTRDVDEKSHEATLEPAHEALLRQWGNLKGWLAEDFGRLATLEGVKRAALDWDANQREPSWASHTGARLTEADQLDARPDLAGMLNTTDRAYLVACRENEKAAEDARQARLRAEASSANSRRLAVIAMGGALFGAIFSGLVVWRWTISENNRRIMVGQTTAATKTANKLVLDIATNIKDISGVPPAVVLKILGVAHDLQEDLAASGIISSELQRIHAIEREETVATCLTLGSASCALDAAQEAVALRQAISDADPSNAELKMDLATAYSSLGAVKKALGDFPGARKYFTEALAIRSAITPSHPRNFPWRSALSSSYDNVGDIEMAQGDLAAALASYRKAQSQRMAIAADDPESPEWRRNLAQSSGRVGDVLEAQGDLAGALEAYRGGVAILEALSVDHPGKIRWRSDLSASYVNVGDVLKAQGDLAGAQKNYGRSLVIREMLSAVDPFKPEWLRDLIDVDLRLSTVEPGKAREHLTKAWDNAKRLADSGASTQSDAEREAAIKNALKALDALPAKPLAPTSAKRRR